MNTIDGAPDAMKVACPVLAGGKAGDYFKCLPIRTSRSPLLSGADRLHLVRSAGGRKKHDHPAGNAQCVRGAGG